MPNACHASYRRGLRQGILTTLGLIYGLQEFLAFSFRGDPHDNLSVSSGRGVVGVTHHDAYGICTICPSHGATATPGTLQHNPVRPVFTLLALCFRPSNTTGGRGIGIAVGEVQIKAVKYAPNERSMGNFRCYKFRVALEWTPSVPRQPP